MGYRSDVAYIIKFKSIDDRSKYIEHLHSMENPHIESALDCDALDDYELEDYVYSVHRLETNFS